MRTAKKQATTGEDRALDAAERKDAEDFLRRAHGAAELWRKCVRRRCRRTKTCAGDVDECGARCAPEAWAWVRGMARALREGRPRPAAAQAADRRVAKLEDAGAFGRQPPRRYVITYPGFNERIEVEIAADGQVRKNVGPIDPTQRYVPHRAGTGPRASDEPA
jgi:hypothetical protein